MITVRGVLTAIGRAMVAIIPTRRLVVAVIAISPLWLVSEALAAY